MTKEPNEADVLRSENVKLRSALLSYVYDCRECRGEGGYTVLDPVTSADLWENCPVCSEARTLLGEANV